MRQRVYVGEGGYNELDVQPLDAESRRCVSDQTSNGIAPIKEGPNNVCADETCSTRDENAHVGSSGLATGEELATDD